MTELFFYDIHFTVLRLILISYPTLHQLKMKTKINLLKDHDERDVESNVKSSFSKKPFRPKHENITLTMAKKSNRQTEGINGLIEQNYIMPAEKISKNPPDSGFIFL